MSHTLAQASLPPVINMSRVGCNFRQNTPDKWPWYCLITLLYSKSQHFTILSSPQENIYGWRGEMARPRTAFMWPVRVSFKASGAATEAFAKSQTLMVLSADPVTKNCWRGGELVGIFTLVTTVQSLRRGTTTHLIPWIKCHGSNPS